jgi:predicted ester cyclase
VAGERLDRTNGGRLNRRSDHEADGCTMNEDENKKIVRRFFEEMWNQRKFQVADELLAVDCVTHQLRSGEDPVGVPRSAESVKREAAAWLNGFPDLEFVLEQMIATGDRVVSHCTMRGTHSGVWMGIGPTGRKGEFPNSYYSSYCGRQNR